MANLRKLGTRKDKSTIWQVRWRDLANRQHTRSFPLKVEAEAFKAKVEDTRSHGSDVPAPRAQRSPFADAAEAWFATKHGLKPSARARYRNILDVHLLPSFKGAPISGFTRPVLEAWVQELATSGSRKQTGQPKGLAPRTIRKLTLTMEAILQHAGQPTYKLELPKPQPLNMAFLTEGQYLDLASAIDPRYRSLIIFAARTGLRRGEIAALTAKDIDLVKREVWVRENLPEGYERGAPKSASGSRWVALPSSLAELLRSHPLDVPASWSTWTRKHFRPAVATCVAADPSFPADLRVHDLRHTAISLWVERGDSIREVARRAGHADPAFTLRVYAHARDDDAARDRDRAREDEHDAARSNVSRLPRRRSA